VPGSGEPINPEAWVWYREHIGGGRTPVVDTWWQTETGMIMITPLPGLTTLKPGSATRSFPGVDAAVYDDQGTELGPGEGGGYLVLRRPWPAMLRGLYNEHDRYVQTYWSRFPGVYFAGDGAKPLPPPAGTAQVAVSLRPGTGPPGLVQLVELVQPSAQLVGQPLEMG
jgi:acetyl-CoA synthetase